LGVWWSKQGWFNLLLKLSFFGLWVANGLVALNLLGYIVKR
jgi:hypothetical protein